MLTLCIPTIARFDLLKKAIDSANKGTVKPDRILILDNSGGQCPKIPNTEILAVTPNKGVAGSWNYFFEHLEDDILITNDDVIFLDNTIEELLKGLNEHPEYPMVHALCESDEDNSFSFFIMRKSMWKELNGFDESFFPAYFEDNDTHYRMKLKGFDKYCIPTAKYLHEGSGTLKSYPPPELNDHYRRFNLLQDYYTKKWGGLPGKETYTKPFNYEDE